MGILASSAFVVQYTYYRMKEKSPGQLVFGRYMILPINQVADWRYIRQRKKTQINKEFICENTNRIDHNYRVGDQVMMEIKPAFKYKTLFKGLYKFFQIQTNGSFTLQMGKGKTRVNIHPIKPYKNN